MKGDGLLIYAARKAGYGNREGTSTNEALGVIGARLVQDESVHDAIAEFSRGLVRAISPEAIRAVRSLIRNPKAKDHARAVGMILDRIAPVETTHRLKVEQTWQPPTLEATQAVLQRIAELAAAAGMSKLPAPVDAIDAEFSEVKPESSK